MPQTIVEKILSARSGRDVHAGDIVTPAPDLVIGTDASAPMAIDYFEQMGGDRVFDPARVVFALDHYAPPTGPATMAFHDRVRAFAGPRGIQIFGVGDGISHQIMIEQGRVRPGDLVIGADSHTVTCGALNAFATGVGSSDLAAAMITGEIWLRVPESVLVRFAGTRVPGVAAKDIGLELVRRLGADGANYRALEFTGTDSLGTLTLEDRLVVSNLAVEAGAKAAVFPADDETARYLAARAVHSGSPVVADSGARYADTLTIDLATISPLAARPHAPANVVPLAQVEGTTVNMVFVGTCTGGRVSDLHEALAVLERFGGRIARGVRLVVTPASREVERRLEDDGTLPRLREMGAIITTAGCGACCGTSGVIPDEGDVVISTANRNFKGRMGRASAAIYLASPAACAAAAANGRITAPPFGSRA